MLSRAIAISIVLLLTGLAQADPSIWKRQGWKTDFGQSSIDFNEILSGGPPKDGIPSIDRPKFAAAPKVEDVGPMEPVIQVEINGDVRGYPLQIMTWHEIVNDTVGGVPVSVTYCPLCNSALVFKRTVDGKVLDFGTTGKLRNSDLVMYDRQTESWWQQFIGEGIVGAYTGTKLAMVPVRVVSFEAFKKSHPDGKVLIPNNPAMRQYGRNPYVSYDSRSAPYPLFLGELPKDIAPMARVVVVRDGKAVTAVALQKIRKDGQIRLGDLELAWTKGQNSALDTSSISRGRDVGNVTARKTTASGKTDVVYDITFAFVVNAFHPDTKIVR